MRERIKKIRKDSGLSMDAFGKKIGVGRASVSQWENGKTNVSGVSVKLICKVFNVNEEWLRTGKGEVYLQKEAIVSSYVSEITGSDDDFIKDFIVTYMKLDESSKEVLRRFARDMANAETKKAEQKN